MFILNYLEELCIKYNLFLYILCTYVAPGALSKTDKFSGFREPPNIFST